MNRVNTMLAVMAGTLSGGIALAASSPVMEADLILKSGEIMVPGGWAQALAVKSGVIIALGDNASVAGLLGANTQVIDLAGAVVVPGLHDMHIHPAGAGLWQSRCMFPQGSTANVVVETVKGCVGKKGPGAWITGGSWDTASFGDTPPHRKMLDSVSSGNPVILNDISGHSSLANSRALELAGITRATPDPAGGIIERDASGEPTGVLRESAGFAVSRLVPPSTPEETRLALKWALDQMLSHGITSFTDAGTDPAINQAYATLADSGELKQRAQGCFMWSPARSGSDGKPAPDPTWTLNLHARARFKPDCIKIVLDGVPTSGHTAAMVEPYAESLHEHDVARARGMLMIPAKLLNDTVVDLDRRGWTVKFHAAGDAAVRAGLDAIEAARKANGYTGLHHNVGHNSFIQLSDLQRAARIGATFEMSPYIWYPNPIIPDIAKAVGSERMKRWTPVKDAIDSGALTVPGSDWPVVPSLNPWVAIETLVTRQQPGGGGEELGGAEKITLQQAFDLFTVNSAVQMRTRHLTGSIGKGLMADLLVLDRNPMKIAVTDIHNTKVRMTIINGEIVYRASD